MSKKNGKKVEQDVQTPTYKYLIVSALAEEIQPFYALNPTLMKRVPLQTGAEAAVLKFPNSEQLILTFASARMGMPHNSASIMQIIEKHQPAYVLFIGTCASLKKDAVIGDVLIPKTVFNYELGKYKGSTFHSDNASYNMSEQILRYAESLSKSKPKPRWLKFRAITDDDFSSGSVVVDSASKRKDIRARASRKANGLDMEAFSLGAIQHLQKGKEIGIIKGVMDKGANKTDHYKKKAMKNAARFAYELLFFIEKAESQPIANLLSGAKTK